MGWAANRDASLGEKFLSWFAAFSLSLLGTLVANLFSSTPGQVDTSVIGRISSNLWGLLNTPAAFFSRWWHGWHFGLTLGSFVGIFIVADYVLKIPILFVLWLKARNGDESALSLLQEVLWLPDRKDAGGREGQKLPGIDARPHSSVPPVSLSQGGDASVLRLELDVPHSTWSIGAVGNAPAMIVRIQAYFTYKNPSRPRDEATEFPKIVVEGTGPAAPAREPLVLRNNQTARRRVVFACSPALASSDQNMFDIVFTNSGGVEYKLAVGPLYFRQETRKHESMGYPD